MANSKLDILIEAKNNASKQIAQVKKDLSGLDKTAKELSGGFEGLLKIGGIAGLGALAAGAALVTTELARSAAMADQTRTAFLDLAAQAGQNGREILDALKTASRGSVAESDLMLAANRAMLLGVADNVEEFQQLMSIAEARGKAMGLSTTQAFSDIVTGIGRMSPLILDNLGIVIDGEAAYDAYAESIGKTADALTDAERKQAILNQVVAASADIVAANNVAGENMVDQFERMDAAIQNAKTALGELFAPAVAQIARNIADATVAATDAIRDQQTIAAEGNIWSRGGEITRYIEEIDRLQQRIADFDALGDIGLPMADQARNDLEMVEFGLRSVATAYNEAAAVTGAPLLDIDALMRGEVGFQNAAAAIRGMGDDAATAAAQVDTLMDQLDRAGASMANARAALREQAVSGVRSIAGSLAGDMGGAEAVRWAQQYSVELQQQVALWEQQGISTKDIADIYIPAYLSQLRDANREVSTMAQKVPQISDAWRDMESAIGNVLSGALDPGVGVDAAGILESLGLRPDAINEDARRLADIAVNGFESPWLAYFQSAFPDLFNEAFEGADPKAAAAQLLLDFQDGLRPELLDKERAKELVKRALLGDANMRALSDEIAQELAGELGISLYEAQQAAAQTLGTTGAPELEAQGSNARSAFVIGFDGATVADTFVSGLAARITARASDFTTSGKGAASAWGSGFLAEVGQNVPSALIDILFLRVMPQVQGALATNDALQGAQ